MKTATIPSLRVSPQLRKSAERVLEKGETLSAFVEGAITAQVAQRQMQQEFVKRGIRSGDNARLGGVYVDAEQVVARLEDMLSTARTKSRKATKA